MKTSYIIYIVLFLVAGIVAALYFYYKRVAQRKYAEQQELLKQHKQTVSILVIDKKKERLSPEHIPAAMYEKLPRIAKLKKMPLVKAKVGNQVVTLLCDEKVFEEIPNKKMVRVEVGGIYIVGIKKDKR